MKGIILAASGDFSGAGRGALAPLLGIPLIERCVLALRDAGVGQVAVVAGDAARRIQETLGDGARLGVAISYVPAADWRSGDGASLYAARHAVGDGPFVVAMADHWWDPAIPLALAQRSMTDPAACWLAADRRAVPPPGSERAGSRVLIGPDGAITQVGESLGRYNAVGCGLFVFTPDVFSELERGFENGDHSIDAAANRLAAKGRLFAVVASGRHWERVDTEAALASARRKLVGSLAGRDDGIVSRYLNRRLSLRFSMLAIRAKLTPNAISALSFAIAVASGVAFAAGHLLIGGVMAQVSSILDGSDGEVARARFLASPRGGMVDSILDRIADSVILGGMGFYALSGGVEPWRALAVFAALAVAPMSMMLKDRFQIMAGRKWGVQSDDGLAQYLFASRDGRLFVVFLGGVAGQPLAAAAYIAASGSALVAWRLARAWRRLPSRASGAA